MVETRELVKQTISLQHQTGLLVKKVDVVGVIESKINTKIDSFREGINTTKEKLDNINIQNLEMSTKTLNDRVEILVDNQVEIKDGITNIINQTDDIDESINKVRDQLLSALDEGEKANVEQLNNLSERVTDIERLTQEHVEDTSLSIIKDDIDHVKSHITDLEQEFDEHTTSLDKLLSEVQGHIATLRQKEREVSTLNQSFASLMGKTTKILIDVDDKVCRLAPLYTSPTMDELENSYRELASQDVLDLLSELHQTKSNNAIQSDEESVDTHETEERVYDHTYYDEDKEKVTQHKKGFLASLFGGE